MRPTLAGNGDKENKKVDENGNVTPSDKPKSKRRQETKETSVVGVKEWSSKQVYAKVMLPNKEGKTVGKTVAFGFRRSSQGRDNSRQR